MEERFEQKIDHLFNQLMSDLKQHPVSTSLKIALLLAAVRWIYRTLFK